MRLGRWAPLFIIEESGWIVTVFVAAQTKREAFQVLEAS